MLLNKLETFALYSTLVLTNLQYCCIFVSMRFAGPKKWHIVGLPFPPGTVLVLGSVLQEPSDPESFLIRPSEVEPVSQTDVIDLSDVMTGTIGSQMADSNNASVKALLPHSPWSSGGLSGEGGTVETMNVSADMLNIRAKVFRLTPNSEKEYMAAVLRKSEVTNFVQDCLFTKSLYMIVGVATASKLELQEGEIQEHHAAASADASLPPAGITMAASASHANRKALGFKVSVKGDMDFAYVVREFSYSKMRKRVGKGRDWRTGALYGVDQKEDEHEEEEEFVPEFEGFEDEDVDGGETGFTIIS